VPRVFVGRIRVRRFAFVGRIRVVRRVGGEAKAKGEEGG